MKNKVLTSLLLLSMCSSAIAQQQLMSKQQKMEWFADAKLGIFIHWGLYSVNGISESWSFFNNYINHDNYMKQLSGFNASKYNPAEWVKVIQESGARYAVITTKHHDGISLWNTAAENSISTLKHSAAKKDVLSPFVTELKKSGLKTGLYFSLPDWSYPDYDVFTRDKKRYKLTEEPERWNKFTNYFQGQLDELSAKYNPDLLWFDGDWEHNAAEWQSEKVLKKLRKYNPNIIVNSRLNNTGDYETPEQGIPVLKPASDYWELCYTMNDSWGYQPYDFKYKTPNMIIRTLVDCISMGGNLLLDIGPKADGTIPVEQLNILKALGRWTNKHSEAIYGTDSGIPAQHFEGKTALSKDKKTLYLYVDWSLNDQQQLLLKGIKSKVTQAGIVGTNHKATVKQNSDGLMLKVPSAAWDKDVTVIAVKFQEAIVLTDVTNDAIRFDLLADQKADYTLQINNITTSIQNGKNPFLQTNLSQDGLDFKAGKSTLQPQLYEWVSKNAEGLYKTDKGLPEGHYQGKSALSADKQTIYLFVNGKPSGPIALKGIKNKIARIRIVGEGTMLEPQIFNKLYWSSIPGIIYIPIPAERLDKNLTVIAVLLDGPLDLYREKVGAIESNM